MKNTEWRKVDGVSIDLYGFTKEDEPHTEEIRNYIQYVTEQINKPIIKLVIKNDTESPNAVWLYYKCKDAPFERIRRITGYLVGTLDRWNDAKQAEERERVKHGTEGSLAEPHSETEEMTNE